MRETHRAKSRLRDTAALSITAAAFVIAAPALAQTADSPPAATGQAASRATSYDVEFFKTFAPATALDIARRVPGFAIDFGNGDVRGFAGTAGNVVFNGARPSSKSESIETLLARIPASRVLRVEVGPGDLYGADYAGKSQVLNVVLTTGGGIDGNITAKLTRHFTDPLVPNVEGSVLIKRGDLSLNLAGNTGRNDTVEEGFDRITDASTGALIEFRDKVNHYHEHGPQLSASLAVEHAPTRAFHLNARYAPATVDFEQVNLVTPATGPARNDRLTQDYNIQQYELGGDVTRPLAGGAVKFVALANRRSRDNYDANFNRVNSVVIGGFEQFSRANLQETLGRLNWTRSKLLGMSVELGSEIAYNRLRNATDLFVIGAGGVRTRIDLPVDQATVSEFRTQTYLNAGRGIATGVRLDAGLAYETSHLKVSGDAATERSLQFLKPNATLDLKSGGWHGQLIARRVVAQLDFFDFISSAELSNSRVNGGNADLRPQRSWEFRATIEHPLLKTGLVKLELGHDRVTALQDRILTDEGFDAPGNIGNGMRNFAQLTVDAPLAALGLKGFNVRGDATIQRTRVNDPLTGNPRNWSGFWPDWQWQIDLRRDATNWAAGISLFDRDRFDFFRTDEIDSPFNGGIFVTAFAEYRPDKRTTVRLDVENLTDVTGNRSRVFYFPNRTNPVPSVDEYRQRNSHVVFTLSLRRGFGKGG